MTLVVLIADQAAQHAPATAVWDLAELLDVDVHQFARSSALVAAHHTPAGTVEPGQSSQPVAGQHTVHGRGMQSEQIADAGRPPTPQDPDLDDAPLGPRRRAPRRAERPRRPV